MNNKFQEMMETMMENMMAQMMQKTMEKMMSQMMGSSEPQVASAEAVDSKPQRLTREEFLALEESKLEEIAPKVPLDVECDSTHPRTLFFNQPVSSDVWTFNWMKLKESFPNVKYDPKSKGFHWTADKAQEFRVAARTFKPVETLTDADREAVKEYRRESYKRKAERMMKKAQEM